MKSAQEVAQQKLEYASHRLPELAATQAGGGGLVTPETCGGGPVGGPAETKSPAARMRARRDTTATTGG